MIFIIPNKIITKEQFLTLITNKKIFLGGEAIICKSNNSNSLYKIFSKAGQPAPMGKNKEIKINSLYEIKPDFCVLPISTISLDNVIIGYEMTTESELETSKPEQLSLEELKYFLTKTKDILEYFSSLNIIYGDIAPRNILFNRDTGDIQFCDIDNVIFNENPMDIIPLSLQAYESSRILDRNVHPYMHNMMTLKSLSLDVYWNSKKELRHFFKRPAIKTIESMQEPKHFNNEYIIQHIKKLSK